MKSASSCRGQRLSRLSAQVVAWGPAQRIVRRPKPSKYSAQSLLRSPSLLITRTVSELDAVEERIAPLLLPRDEEGTVMRAVEPARARRGPSRSSVPSKACREVGGEGGRVRYTRRSSRRG